MNFSRETLGIHSHSPYNLCWFSTWHQKTLLFALVSLLFCITVTPPKKTFVILQHRAMWTGIWMSVRDLEQNKHSWRKSTSKCISNNIHLLFWLFGWFCHCDVKVMSHLTSSRDYQHYDSDRIIESSTFCLSWWNRGLSTQGRPRVKSESQGPILHKHYVKFKGFGHMDCEGFSKYNCYCVLCRRSRTKCKLAGWSEVTCIWSERGIKQWWLTS